MLVVLLELRSFESSEDEGQSFSQKVRKKHISYYRNQRLGLEYRKRLIALPYCMCC